MRELARRDCQFQFVQSLASQVPSPSQIDGLFRECWKEVPDPDECEYIREPRYQAAFYFTEGFLEGDCDDAAVLASCLLTALGWPNLIVAIRRPGNPEYSHVFCVAVENDQTIHIDPIVPAEYLPITDIAEVMTDTVLG